MSQGPPDFTSLKLLLEREQYPLEFTLKLIGRNTPGFQESILKFEKAQPILGQRQFSRESSKGNQVAITYVFRASMAEEIVDVYRSATGIVDLLIIL